MCLAHPTSCAEGRIFTRWDEGPVLGSRARSIKTGPVDEQVARQGG